MTADDASFYQARAFEVLDSLLAPYEAVTAARIRFRVRGVMKEYTWGGADAAWTRRPNSAFHRLSAFTRDRSFGLQGIEGTEVAAWPASG